MRQLFAAVLLVGAVALVTRGDAEPAPAPQPVVEQRDVNAGPPGSVG